MNKCKECKCWFKDEDPNYPLCVDCDEKDFMS